MNESERRKVVLNLKEKKKIYDESKKSNNELKELEQTETLKRYFCLRDKLIKLNEQVKKWNGLDSNTSFENLINREFKKSFSDRKFTKREHPIYIYIGSYKTSCDYGYESKPYNVRVLNESVPDYEYNIYKCICCGYSKEVYGDKYKEFEKNHNILKDYEFNMHMFEKFQKLYYKYLYSHKLETAQKELEDLFSKMHDKKENILSFKIH